MREFFGGERPPEDERQRGDADAVDVGSDGRTAHGPGRGRHRDAELLPQPLAAELQLLDRRSEHVLDDHQPRVRRDDEALGRDQSVRGVARVLVQQRDGGHQLTNQAERGVGVQLQAALVRDAQHVREPRALDVIGDDRQPAATGARSTRRTRA